MNIFKEYEDYELREMWRKSDKLEDKRYLASFGFESDVHDLMHDPRWSQDKRIKEAIIIKHGMYLDTFVHDPDEDIRAAVASKGRDEDLKILVHDPSVKLLLSDVSKIWTFSFMMKTNGFVKQLQELAMTKISTSLFMTRTGLFGKSLQSKVERRILLSLSTT